MYYEHITDADAIRHGFKGQPRKSLKLYHHKINNTRNIQYLAIMSYAVNHT